jgi:putative ABC transport system substrate-binding protein
MRPSWRRFAAGALVLSTLWGCANEGVTSQPTPPVTVAILRAVRSTEPGNVEAFFAELDHGGFTVGKNLTVIGADPAEVHPDPADAESTVRGWAKNRLDLVVALSSSGAMAASRAAPGTKVLFLSNDPMAVGLVKDERRPEGHLTGATFRVPADRTLDVARQVIPGLQRVGLLYPPADPAAAPVVAATTKAAANLGLEVSAGPFSTTDEIDSVMQGLRDQGIGCLILANSPTTVRSYPAITAALARQPLPVVTNTDADFALVVLEPDARELYRQMGRQAVRLLHGSLVSQVPVEDPAGFRFVLNLGVADRLGLQISPDVERKADAVVRP